MQIRDWCSTELATARLRYVDGRAISTMSGLVTARHWPVLVAEHAARVGLQAPISTLFDLRGAVLALTAAEMADGVLARCTTAAVGGPKALLANQINEPILREFAWSMAGHGLVRGVFTDALRAAVWLEAQERALQAAPALAAPPAGRRPRTGPTGP